MRTVVLEPEAAGGPPDRNEFLVTGQAGRSGREQPPEPHVTAADSFEEEDWRDGQPCVRTRMGGGEHLPQELVAAPWGVVQVPARPAVVAVVGEVARGRFDVVGPIELGPRGVQDDHLYRSLRHAAGVPEPALVTNREQLPDGVVTRVTPSASQVDAVDDQVGVRQLCERHRLCHHVQILPGV